MTMYMPQSVVFNPLNYINLVIFTVGTVHLKLFIIFHKFSPNFYLLIQVVILWSN